MKKKSLTQSSRVTAEVGEERLVMQSEYLEDAGRETMKTTRHKFKSKPRTGRS